MQKNNKGLYVALSVIMGIFIVLGLVVIISVVAGNKTPKLNPKTIEAKADDTETAVGESTAVSQNFDDTIVNVSENFGTEASTEAVAEDEKKEEEPVAEEKKPEDNLQEQQTVADNGGYICSFISDRIITAEDMKTIEANNASTTFPGGRSLSRMIINDIYAKYGYVFTKQELNDYYANKSWYTASEKDMQVVLDKMTEIEKKNVAFLESYKGN